LIWNTIVYVDVNNEYDI